MGYPEYAVGYREPEDFEKQRKIFRDAVELASEAGQSPSDTMYVVALKGPAERLDLILERLDDDGALVGDTHRPDELTVTLLASLGRYHPDSDRSASADSFTALYPHEDGSVSTLALEASWIESIEMLGEPEIKDIS